MPSQAERNRIYSEIGAIKTKISQIGAEIGRCRNRIDSLKGSKAEYRDTYREERREAARQERMARRGNYVREPDWGVIGLYREKNELYEKKNKLYALPTSTNQERQPLRADRTAPDPRSDTVNYGYAAF
jgi:chromosome segregation ATPase